VSQPLDLDETIFVPATLVPRLRMCRFTPPFPACYNMALNSSQGYFTDNLFYDSLLQLAGIEVSYTYICLCVVYKTALSELGPVLSKDRIIGKLQRTLNVAFVT
jgi:hypothetical protein